MPKQSAHPRPLRILRGDAEIKAYAHPTRMEILRLLAGESGTVSGVARELQVHPANLTHHFKLLKDAGLIRLEKTLARRNLLEKHYRAAARNFAVASGGSKRPGRKALALSILRDDLSLALATLKEKSGQEVLGLLKTARLDRKDFAAMAGEMDRLVRRFAGRDRPGGTAYNLNLSLYPNDTPARPSGEILIA